MSQDWVDRFLERRESEKIKQVGDIQSTQRAQHMSLPMLRDLRNQIERNLRKYVDGTGDRSIAFEVVSTEGFTVHREKYPYFHLEVTCIHSGFLDYNFTLRKSQSADGQHTDGRIIIIAGPVGDEFYYRLDGENYSDPNRVSEELLSPLFEALEKG